MKTLFEVLFTVVLLGKAGLCEIKGIEEMGVDIA